MAISLETFRLGLLCLPFVNSFGLLVYNSFAAFSNQLFHGFFHFQHNKKNHMKTFNQSLDKNTETTLTKSLTLLAYNFHCLALMKNRISYLSNLLCLPLILSVSLTLNNSTPTLGTLSSEASNYRANNWQSNKHVHSSNNTEFKYQMNCEGWNQNFKLR